MNAIQTARKLGYKSIMINYNPETVSMIKKRLLSFLGAAAITAALTFAVVSLSPSNGFTSGTMQEGLCYEATGVAPDAIVASLNGNGASADLVAYWIGYDVSYLNSYKIGRAHV